MNCGRKSPFGHVPHLHGTTARHWQTWLAKVNETTYQPLTAWLSSGKQPGGDRILTNLIHLGEKLHQTATQRRLGPKA